MQLVHTCSLAGRKCSMQEGGPDLLSSQVHYPEATCVLTATGDAAVSALACWLV